jgi:hypothetical protein
VFITALPVYIVNTRSDTGPYELTVIDYAGIAVWVVGFGCEALADFQKAQWSKIKVNKRFINTGLWSLSRHPNCKFVNTRLIYTLLLVAVLDGCCAYVCRCVCVRGACRLWRNYSLGGRVARRLQQFHSPGAVARTTLANIRGISADKCVGHPAAGEGCG